MGTGRCAVALLVITVAIAILSEILVSALEVRGFMGCTT